MSINTDPREDIPTEAGSGLRLPPHSTEAEQSVLGGLLTDNGAWDRVGDLLTEGDFYRHEHRLIFSAIGALVGRNKVADVITVFEHLQGIGKAADVGGLKHLNALAQSVPSAANARRYAEIVRERSILRKLIGASDEIATAAFNTQGKSVDKILDEAGAVLNSVLETGAGDDDWTDMGSLVVREMDELNARAEKRGQPDHFIPTGIEALDELLDGGLRGGQFVFIGARPSMGKTALADTIGTNVALRVNLPVGKFSMEMQNAEGAQRALSSAAGIPLHALRRPERMTPAHWSRLPEGVERIARIPFYSYDRGGLNINQVRARARALRRKHGLRLLMLDYIQLMSGTDTRQPRHAQLEEASRGIKTLAKELGIPIIVLGQVNRGVEKEADPMPRMSDIKDCGSIEQDADIILFLHRQWVHKPGLAQEWKPYAQARLAKQRGGRTGEFALHYEGEFTRFTDWPADTPVPSNVTVTRGGGL